MAQQAPGQLPKNEPLQPTPQFVKPNLSGNVNFDADQQAAQQLQELNGAERSNSITEESTAPADPQAVAFQADKVSRTSNVLIVVMLAAVVVLLLGWWWFIRRAHKRAAIRASAERMNTPEAS